MEAAQGLKEKAATWVINRIRGMVDSKIDIAELQRANNANEGRITQMRLLDIKKEYHFRVKDGKLELLNGTVKPDGGFDLTVDTLIDMARGKQRRMNPATREEFTVPFTPIDAVTQGCVRIWGEGASNDMLMFARNIYKHVWPQLREDADKAVRGVQGVNGHG